MIDVFFGFTPGQAVEIKADGEWTQTDRSTSEPGHVITQGELVEWTRAIVSTTARANGKRRVFILAPDDNDNELVLGAFRIAGGFIVEEKINNSRKAKAAFGESSLTLLR